MFDFEDTFILIAAWTNPTYLARLLLKWILGWDPADMVIENKNDEEHYYAGKVYKSVVKGK